MAAAVSQSALPSATASALRNLMTGNSDDVRVALCPPGASSNTLNDIARFVRDHMVTGLGSHGGVTSQKLASVYVMDTLRIPDFQGMQTAAALTLAAGTKVAWDTVKAQVLAAAHGHAQAAAHPQLLVAGGTAADSSAATAAQTGHGAGNGTVPAVLDAEAPGIQHSTMLAQQSGGLVDFVVTPQERAQLIAQRAANGDRVLPPAAKVRRTHYEEPDPQVFMTCMQFRANMNLAVLDVNLARSLLRLDGAELTWRLLLNEPQDVDLTDQSATTLDDALLMFTNLLCAKATAVLIGTEEATHLGSTIVKDTVEDVEGQLQKIWATLRPVFSIAMFTKELASGSRKRLLGLLNAIWRRQTFRQGVFVLRDDASGLVARAVTVEQRTMAIVQSSRAAYKTGAALPAVELGDEGHTASSTRRQRRGRGHGRGHGDASVSREAESDAESDPLTDGSDDGHDWLDDETWNRLPLAAREAIQEARQSVEADADAGVP